jgi:acyl-CoA reductase-like NAD-dependent aldehyde dehydrogenase
LQRTISGGASVNETLMHALVEELPFGGVGASGIGAYHGEIGFQTFSHRKGIFFHSQLNFLWLLRPPFGALTNAVLRLLMMR